MPRIRNVGDLDWELDRLSSGPAALNVDGEPLLNDLLPLPLRRSVIMLKLELDFNPSPCLPTGGIFYLYQQMRTSLPDGCVSSRPLDLFGKGRWMPSDWYYVGWIARVLSRECLGLLVTRPFGMERAFLYQMGLNTARPFSKIRYPTKYLSGLINRINRSLR